MWKKGGGTSLLGRRDWMERYFVLQGGVLTYFHTSDDFKRNKVPLKDVAYRMKHCACEALPEDLHIKGQFAFQCTPLDPKGGPRPLLLRCASDDARLDWLRVMTFDPSAAAVAAAAAATPSMAAAIVVKKGKGSLTSRLFSDTPVMDDDEPEA
jgi:hypothetical protein